MPPTDTADADERLAGGYSDWWGPFILLAVIFLWAGYMWGQDDERHV
jgi:hypothetical protein